MKILYYDCFSGISGDMNLGALVDLGVPFEYLKEELNKLSLNNEFNIIKEKSIKNGITGTKIEVIDLNNIHKHNHKNHNHGRNYGEIQKIIKESLLDGKIKKLALDIFEEIAIAEGKVHDKAVEEVHFHEVGAIDSIVDIVGASICICFLKVDKIIASSIEVGYGMIKCAHGMMPVPAPATAEILKNIEIKAENVPFEATTPTGAAIIKTIASEFTDKKEFKITKISYGIGKKENPKMANVLRVFLGETRETNKEDEYVLECNIDDMRAEEQELLMERLFEAKALDVYFTNIFMKKQRLAVKLSVICSGEFKEKLKMIIFFNSSTIGIREYKVNRTKLKRDNIEIESDYGKVDAKISFYKGKVIRIKPEYDNCKEIANKRNISLNEVYNRVLFNYENNKKKY